MVVRGKRSRRCRFCSQLFLPDPRLKGRQSACSAPECQRRRKEAGQERWLARNPGYFEGRYPKVKAWLSSHTGYLARYRHRHPEKVESDNQARKRRCLRARAARADIQVARSLQVPVQKALAPVLAGARNADIQVPLLSQVIVVSLFSAVYLTRARADIQDPIASRVPDGYPPRHELAQKAVAPAGARAEGPQVLQLD
jgi:hypothetical protein